MTRSESSGYEAFVDDVQTPVAAVAAVATLLSEYAAHHSDETCDIALVQLAVDLIARLARGAETALAQAAADSFDTYKRYHLPVGPAL